MAPHVAEDNVKNSTNKTVHKEDLCDEQSTVPDAKMTSHTTEENVKHSTNKNVSKEDLCEEQHAPKRTRFQRKVFIPRNSLLTDLASANQLNVLLSIITSLYVSLVTCTILYYLVDPQEFWRDVRIMRESCNFPHFLKMWLSLNAYALMVFKGFKLWIKVRSKCSTKYADNVALCFFVTAFVSIFIAFPCVLHQETNRPFTDFAFMLEQVRVSMKIYSFVRECAPRVLKHDSSKDGDQDWYLCPSAKHFLYFLFIPTLIYRNAYPRKQKIDWKFAAKTSFQFASCVLIGYCIFMRFGNDVLAKAGRQAISLPQAVLILAACIPAGGVLLLAMFCGIIHFWMNLGAELTRFADREFYQDWWNSTSLDEYFRKWNIVINDWLYAYVYVDSRKLGLDKNRSLVLVFFISAVFHEYIISCTLRFFYPALFIDFSLASVPLLFLSRRSKSRFWNIFLWGGLSLGFGKCVCLYTMEWYARANCDRTVNSSLDLFYPRTWDRSCRILSYS